MRLWTGASLAVALTLGPVLRSPCIAAVLCQRGQRITVRPKECTGKEKAVTLDWEAVAAPMQNQLLSFAPACGPEQALTWTGSHYACVPIAQAQPPGWECETLAVYSNAMGPGHFGFNSPACKDGWTVVSGHFDVTGTPPEGFAWSSSFRSTNNPGTWRCEFSNPESKQIRVVCGVSCCTNTSAAVE